MRGDCQSCSRRSRTAPTESIALWECCIAEQTPSARRISTGRRASRRRVISEHKPAAATDDDHGDLRAVRVAHSSRVGLRGRPRRLFREFKRSCGEIPPLSSSSLSRQSRAPAPRSGWPAVAAMRTLSRTPVVLVRRSHEPPHPNRFRHSGVTHSGLSSVEALLSVSVTVESLFGRSVTVAIATVFSTKIKSVHYSQLRPTVRNPCNSSPS